MAIRRSISSAVRGNLSRSSAGRLAAVSSRAASSVQRNASVSRKAATAAPQWRQLSTRCTRVSTLRCSTIAKPVIKSKMTSTRRWLSSAAAGDNKTIDVPALGDSITEGTVISFTKAVGDHVAMDDVIAVVETDKVSVDIRSPMSGKITEFCVSEGDTVEVGANLVKIIEGEAPAGESKAAEKPKEQEKAKETEKKPSESSSAAAAPREDSSSKSPPKSAPKASAPKSKTPASEPKIAEHTGSRTETRVPMTRMRLRIAERLKDAQNTAAMLTTFNEIDMSELMKMRSKFKDEFLEKHGVKLGFMSAFVKSSAAALMAQPEVNAVIDGKDIVYRDYVDISVAVATPTGLVVPVLRNAQDMSFAGVESSINALGQKARKGQIAIEDMVGGTFTISNGGVYGSLMGTPIINPPQSAILGMHGIFKRPVVVGDKVEIRPMMYVALTYDHRIIDGGGAVTFLKRIKNNIEDPARMLLEL